MVLDPIDSVTALGEPRPEIDQPHHLHALRSRPVGEIDDIGSVGFPGLVVVGDDHYLPAPQLAPVGLAGRLGTVGGRGGNKAQRHQSVRSLLPLCHVDRPFGSEHLGEPIERPGGRHPFTAPQARRGDRDRQERLAGPRLPPHHDPHEPAGSVVIVPLPSRLPPAPYLSSKRRLPGWEGGLLLAGGLAGRSTW